jgi:hypothetical protein
MRGGSFIDWITSLLKPLNTKSLEWTTFDVETRKRTKINAQIVILTAALNDIFGIGTSPFIYIQTVTGTGYTNYLYNDSEGVTLFVYNDLEGINSYFYNNSEINEDYEFIVYIPIGIYTAELNRRIINEVNKYKLSGTRFITLTY